MELWIDAGNKQQNDGINWKWRAFYLHLFAEVRHGNDLIMKRMKSHFNATHLFCMSAGAKPLAIVKF